MFQRFPNLNTASRLAEFDAMVGEYVSTIASNGVTDNTVFIVTSDHGDMNVGLVTCLTT